MLQIALYQPDIAPNAATIIRMAACFGLRVTIIEPAGFAWTDSSFRRAGMDYLGRAQVERCPSWEDFQRNLGERQLLLITTKGAVPYHQHKFQGNEVLLLGQEGSGVPPKVHEQANARLLIPMRPGERSLNVALACAIVTGEALRQTNGFV